jgi:hypothetical protein
MKGSIFKLFEDFVATNHGPDAFDELLDRTELETTEPFVGPGNYPAGDLMALVGAAVEQYRIPVDELLRSFGRHSFPKLAESVADLIVGLDDPVSFLLHLESVVHTEVRKLDPDASPARFTAVERGPGDVALHYQSPFGLFALVEGFLQGIGDWYRVPVNYEIESIEGTNAVFKVMVGAGKHAGFTAPRESEPAADRMVS